MPVAVPRADAASFDDDDFTVQKATQLSREKLLSLQVRIGALADEVKDVIAKARTMSVPSSASVSRSYLLDQLLLESESTLRRKNRQVHWINIRLAELKRREKRKRIADHARDPGAAEAKEARKVGFHEAFFNACLRRVSAMGGFEFDTFHKLCREAEEASGAGRP